MSVLVATTALMLALMLGGVWVAASLGLAGAFALDQLLSYERMISVMGKMAWQQSTSFILIALPLFILMGEILLQAGLMSRIYEAASKIVSGLPGGLLQTNIAASTVFAACTGSSLASAATIGSVAYPALAARGYDRRLSLGSIAAGGTLGILIPPSIIFIIYGGLAEVSIGALFLAGLLPGLLLAGAYAFYIAICALLRPSLAPKERSSNLREKLRALASLWQVLLLIVVVLGGIYGGIASPTEIAAIASALALLLAAVNRSLSLAGLWTACLNTVRQTSMILLVVAMAKVLSLALIYSQTPTLAAEWVESVGARPAVVVLALLALYVALGMFFDGISMMVVTIPFVVPIMQALNVDLVWLGVLICMTIEIGLLTPPVGLNLYVMQGATGEPFRTIMQGALPFVGCQALVIGLIFLFPDIATLLPKQLS